FHLEPEMIAGVVAPRGGGLPATRPVREHARLAGTLLAAHRALDEGGDREVGIRLLRDALVALFAPRGRRPAGVAPSHTTPDPRVARARALLETRYRCGIALEDLARASGSSRHHLVRLFREEVGVTPYDYLIQVRVRRAQELLAAGWPIVEAAQEVGFADQSHLHRHFKRRLGVTPGAFVRG
ncbi:MAG TPA: helix-turn-helix transcriptional regulator, partial [Thermoanaerobaculia bacterium]|nr:helix-turn-helix transcriptional regulator [Thermoanaerobaculia bacterium]